VPADRTKSPVYGLISRGRPVQYGISFPGDGPCPIFADTPGFPASPSRRSWGRCRSRTARRPARRWRRPNRPVPPRAVAANPRRRAATWPAPRRSTGKPRLSSRECSGMPRRAVVPAAHSPPSPPNRRGSERRKADPTRAAPCRRCGTPSRSSPGPSRRRSRPRALPLQDPPSTSATPASSSDPAPASRTSCLAAPGVRPRLRDGFMGRHATRTSRSSAGGEDDDLHLFADRPPLPWSSGSGIVRPATGGPPLFRSSRWETGSWFVDG
jgi:hypothetical protein